MARAAFLALALSLSIWAGCHDEPTIVITFAPQDLAGGARDLAAAKVALAPASDGGTAVTRAAADGGAAKTAAQAVEKCARDADCVLAQDGCCACSSGGKRVAIAKSRAKAFAAKQALECKHTMCPMFVSNDPSCAEVVAVCRAGACGYKAK